jgi:hypothetical protein
MLMVMKKFSTLIMVMALLVMNIASIAHAECSAIGVCDGVQVVKSVDDSGDQGGDTQKTVCDCCATCGHHHHTHASLAHTKTDHMMDMSKTQRRWDGGATYLSQLHYPPSKPPKV